MLKLPPLTIFEGPDCSGKTTAALGFKSRRHHATRLIHHGPYKGIKDQLPRFYVDAMLPMLLGFEEQIWDRSWLSEPIYGAAFRKGEDRVGKTNRRHLERFALRHGAVVVLCLPPWESVIGKWEERKGDEYLDTANQLSMVYESYNNLKKNTHLPVVRYDYTRHSMETLAREIERVRPPVHTELHVNSGGHLSAEVVLVGDAASDPTDKDTVFQIPFASFANGRSSAWLTSELERFGIREDQLLWVNQEDGVDWLKGLHLKCVIALGDKASIKLDEAGIVHTKVNHPAYHLRYKRNDFYPLLDMIDDCL